VIEEPELENEKATTKGERYAMSVIAPRDSCYVVVKLEICVNVEGTDDQLGDLT
jgi:hypothetical protein